jgi:hypothetical protein
MRNYYTFLYGLPMKLADPGTIIDPVVVKKEFMGKEYLVLKSNMKKDRKDSGTFILTQNLCDGSIPILP